MVEAGFFFFEPPEYVPCFSCGFGKKKWLGFSEHPILIHVDRA